MVSNYGQECTLVVPSFRVERIYFENLLAQEHGSMSRVAERSGLERTHLYRKLKALGLPVGRREES